MVLPMVEAGHVSPMSIVVSHSHIYFPSSCPFAESMFEVPTNLLILLSLLYGSISLIAVIGNALVIWIVVTTRQMHTVTNFFIGNLAMADVVIGLFSIPFQFQAAVLQRWDLPRFMCPFCPFVQVLSVNVSIFTLTAIAIDRHKAILNPLRARSSKHASKIVIGIIWTMSLFLAAPISYGLRVVDLTVQYDISKLTQKNFLSQSIPSWKLSAVVSMSFGEVLLGFVCLLTSSAVLEVNDEWCYK